MTDSYVKLFDDNRNLIPVFSLEGDDERTDVLRADKKNSSLVFLSFPGDEEAMGGCLASGRGFFHINVEGAAEPCPFSPFSVANVQETSLLGALRSPFFEKVQEVSHAHDSAEEHMGGCTLFQHKDGVMALMQAS